MKHRKYLSALGLFVLLFMILNFDSQDYKKAFNNAYNIFAVPHPGSIQFANEPAPMERDDVAEAFDRELLVNTYWQSQTLLFIKRAHKYFPVIEPILEEYNVPEDFKYLALIESGLTNAVSPANAVGYWQLLKGTAQDYGLTINDEIDERYHLVKSTEAACRYFNEAYDKFKNWTLVAAAYNMGKSGLALQMVRQEQDDYYNLMLGEETGRYVYRILAVKEILTNTDNYGFQYRKDDLYRPDSVYYVNVDTAVKSFGQFAAQFNLSYKELKYYNPWLRESYLTNRNNENYRIAIPHN
ncbi:MAG: transglycosylase SLT domain-containing protein [Bacteroidetes bacterium]|jgi:hypothetical protein|nr:transglycosylase SLT domain-containing protein [Bacteroidota bacterium]